MRIHAFPTLVAGGFKKTKCPTGYYKSGGEYCKPISSSDREAQPRDKGGKCPTGWRKSGGYCVKQ